MVANLVAELRTLSGDDSTQLACVDGVSQSVDGDGADRCLREAALPEGPQTTIQSSKLLVLLSAPSISLIETEPFLPSPPPRSGRVDVLQNSVSSAQAMPRGEHATSGGGSIDASGIEKKLFDRQSRFEGALMQVRLASIHQRDEPMPKEVRSRT